MATDTSRAVQLHVERHRRSVRTRCRPSRPTAPARPASSTIVNVTVPVDSTPAGRARARRSRRTSRRTAVTLTWTAATDDRGVAGYRVVRNGTVLPGTVTGTDLHRQRPHARHRVPLHGAGGRTRPATSDPTAARSTSPRSPSARRTCSPTCGPRPTAARGQAAWIASTSAGTVDTLTNAGRLTFNNTSGAYARAQLTGLAARTNAEVLFSYRWSATGASALLHA